VATYYLVLSVGMDQSLSLTSALSTIIVLYVGPDQLMPVASALAAGVGILLMVWHRTVALSRRMWQYFTKRPTVAGSQRAALKTMAGENGGSDKRNVDTAG